MDAKTEAKNILDAVVRQGASTDNFYSKDFYSDCKRMAVARAKAKFESDFLEEVILELEG